MNLLVAVAFQNCKPNENADGYNGKRQSTDTIEQSQSESAMNLENSDDQSPNDSDVIHRYPGETDDVILFEQDGPMNPAFPVRLVVTDFSKEIGEVQFKIVGRKKLDHQRQTIVQIWCQHSSIDGTKSFDCAQSDEFILEGLTAGRHQLRVMGEDAEGRIFESPQLTLVIQEKSGE